MGHQGQRVENDIGGNFMMEDILDNIEIWNIFITKAQLLSVIYW